MAPGVAQALAPFVGRETALQALLAAIDATARGERVVALVAGEPGIGKTRLVTEVTARLTTPVLWSACWEGDGAPAYWPWQQLVRALQSPAAERDLSELFGQAGAPDQPDGARFRLFDAVVGVFSAAAERQPLVLVMEDLHWADEPSIRLLQFLAHDPRSRGLAIIGTYRESELEESHPLHLAVGALARGGPHVSLTGLAKRDVAALATALTGSRNLSPGAVSLLHRRTGGNPLFLRELVQLLQLEQRLDSVTDGGPSGAIPTTVRAVIGQRLGRLAGSTHDVLAAAAVVGAEFDAATLASVMLRTPEDVLAATSEAASAGLLVRTGDRAHFGFAHAVVREVLYEGLDAAARLSLHRAMADLLEGRAEEDRLSELAHHMLQAAASPQDCARAADYAERAGTHNMSLLAYEEAAAWFARALDAMRGGPPDDARRADLLVKLGEASLAAGNIPQARDAYQEAGAIARRRGDAERLAHAALGLGSGLGGFEVRLLDPVQVDLLEDALVALGPQPSALRAWVLARLSVALSFMDAEARRRALTEEAVATARDVGAPRALGYALAAHCDVVAGPGSCELRREEAEEVVRLGQKSGDRPLELLGRRLRLVALLEMGDVGDADAEIERFARVADALRQPLYRWYVPLWRGMRALMRGELEVAARHRAEAEAIGALAHSANATVLTFTQWWVQQRYEGAFVAAGTAMAELLEQDVAAAPVFTWPRAIAATQMGDHDKALALIREGHSSRLYERAKDESEWLPETAQLAEAAVLVGAREEAEILYRLLEPYAGRFCVEGIGAAFTGSVAWYLSLVARFLGREADAEGYAAQAAAAHRRVGLVGDPPPLAAPLPATGTRPVRAPAGSASMIREGATWAVTFAGRAVRLRDSKGLRDLAVLLAGPEHDVHCLELMGGAEVGAEPGPALDGDARRAYERRIRELQEEIDEARDNNDPARAERAEAELDALVQQLAEAFGLSGRARATGSTAERARSAVRWRVRAAVRQASEVYPELGRHLEHAVRTGTWCSYRPETAITWNVDAGQGRSP